MLAKKISVILASFNGAKYIDQQIDSILNQENLPDEIIICDDKSTDDTIIQLNKYQHIPQIKVYANEQNLGVIENFKRGVKLAKQGNWIVFSDQDDIWLPEKLNLLSCAMAVLDNGLTPALIYSDLALIDKNNVKLPLSFWESQKIYPPKINLQKLLFGNIVSGCTVIINRSMADEFLKMNNSQFLHDEWLTLIAYTIGKVRFLEQRLVLYRQHESNLTFSEKYRTWHFLDHIYDIFLYLSGKKKFLKHQFELAKCFLNTYEKSLTDKQVDIFKSFIKLENRGYLFIRIYRRLIYFRN